MNRNCYRRPLLLLVTIAALAFATDASAQVGNTYNFSGTWELTEVDGSPIREGIVALIEFSPQPDGTFLGEVFLDTGEGPEEIEDEELILEQIEPNYWVWTNARGHSGHVTYNPYTGQFETTVDTGPNTGTARAMHRL